MKAKNNAIRIRPTLRKSKLQKDELCLTKLNVRFVQDRAMFRRRLRNPSGRVFYLANGVREAGKLSR